MRAIGRKDFIVLSSNTRFGKEGARDTDLVGPGGEPYSAAHPIRSRPCGTPCMRSKPVSVMRRALHHLDERPASPRKLGIGKAPIRLGEDRFDARLFERGVIYTDLPFPPRLRGGRSEALQ
jgi:hypothetical protein